MNMTSNDNLQETKQPMLETHDKGPQLTLALTHSRPSMGYQNKEIHNIISGSIWLQKLNKPLFKVWYLNLTNDLHFNQNSLIHTMFDQASTCCNTRITTTPKLPTPPPPKKKVFFDIPFWKKWFMFKFLNKAFTELIFLCYSERSEKFAYQKSFFFHIHLEGKCNLPVSSNTLRYTWYQNFFSLK